MSHDDETFDGKAYTSDRLKNLLFQTIEGVRKKNITPEQAKAISETAQTIVNVTKTELDYARIHNTKVPTTFIPQAKLVEKESEGEE